MNNDKQQKARVYEKTRIQLFLVNLVLTLLLLAASFVVGKNGGASAWFARWIESWSPNVLITVGIYALGGLFAALLLFLPLRFYSSYIVEHRYALSNQTVGGWFKDWMKSLAVDVVVTVLMLEVLYALMRFSAQYWWLWAAGAWILFAVLMSQLFPVLILPLFYKLKPLEDAVLVNRLVALAQKVKAKILGVFSMNMSRKTKKANAMLAGLGKTKRIILGDTLLQHYTPDEIEVVLAHELAHFYYRHMWKKIGISCLTSVVGLYLANEVLTALIAYFGFHGLADVANFPLLVLVLSLFFLVLMPMDNALSRYYEKQCDLFALNQTQNAVSFISAMKRLAEQNLADLNPSPLVEFLFHDHPAIGKRIAMGEKFLAKASAP